MKEIFDKFMDRYQAERNPAKNTVLTLKQVIPRFLSFIGTTRGRTNLNQVDREDVLAYLNSLEGRTSTKRVHKAMITLFLNACLSYGLRSEKMPTIQFKGPSDVPRAPLKGFTAEEMALMRKNSRRLGLRERIIFSLLSTRPLRISELANLTVGDIDLSAKTFTISRSKNHKTRVISLPRETWKDLEELIGENAPRERSLFGIGLRMMEWTVSETIKKLRVAPNGRGSHAFRHTVIMGMLRDARIDPAVVATIAGNTPKTIYANYSSQVSVDEQRRAEKAFDRMERKE